MFKSINLPFNYKLYTYVFDKLTGDSPYRFIGFYAWCYKSTDKYSKKYPNRSRWDGYIEVDLFCRRLVVNLAKYPHKEEW